MGFFKKIQTIRHNTTTYRVGLLQTKTYRILKQHTSKVLSEFDITSVEWAMLGLLYDARDGMRANQLALELGVEPPFITQTVNRLKKTEFIDTEQDSVDNRAKILRLSSKGRGFVDKTERYLRDATKPLLRNIPLKDLMSYLSVMQSIIDNE